MGTPEQRYRRHRRVIDPALQLKIIGTFVLLAGISTALQALALIRALGTLASHSGEPVGELMDRVRALVIEHVAIGLLVCLPMFVVVGIFVTFRVAGPLYHIRRYLEELVRDGYKGPCRIRRDDELQDLCRVLNQAIDLLRAAPAAREPLGGAKVEGASPDSLGAQAEPALPTPQAILPIESRRG